MSKNTVKVIAFFVVYIMGFVALISGLVILDINIPKILIGIALVSFPLWLIIFLIRSGSRIRLLKKNGIVIQAKITDVLYDGRNSSDGKSNIKYYIYAYYIHNDMVYYYRSKSLTYNPKEFIDKNNIDKVDVYVNPNNYGYYYMNVRSLNKI